MAMRGNFICKKNYLLSRVVLLYFFQTTFANYFGIFTEKKYAKLWTFTSKLYAFFRILFCKSFKLETRIQTEDLTVAWALKIKTKLHCAWKICRSYHSLLQLLFSAQYFILGSKNHSFNLQNFLDQICQLHDEAKEQAKNVTIFSQFCRRLRLA